MIYLASPYTDPDPAIEQQRFDAVCRAAAALMRRGLHVFAPIVQSHPITRFGLPTNWAYWQAFDSEMLELAEQFWVLMLPGWDASEGVRAETQLAVEMNKPIRMVLPSTLTPVYNREYGCQEKRRQKRETRTRRERPLPARQPNAMEKG